MKASHRRLSVLINHLKQTTTSNSLVAAHHRVVSHQNSFTTKTTNIHCTSLQRNFHHDFALQFNETKCNLEKQEATSFSTNFKQYWESIYSYIQKGDVSLEESIKGVVHGININNINKVEIPEDISQKLAQMYMKNLDKNGKIRFFEVMIMHFGGVPIAPLLQMMSNNVVTDNSNTLLQTLDKMKGALQNVQSSENVERNILGYLNTIQQLRTSLEPYYEKFLEQFILILMKKEISIGSQSMNGLEFVMQMRKDLLDIIATLQKQQSTPATSDYKKFILPILLSDLNTNLVRLLSSWFSPSFLECKELDWRETNAQLVEKIIHYERVHPIANMEALKNRLAPTPNRKMYGLFHAAMPRVPLVVLQVALMDSIASNMRQVHDIEKAKATPNVNTAIFYSISSTQAGLTGIELGNYLIKKVVGILQQKQLVSDNYGGDIVQFSTLSPIPSFMKWLSQKLRIECSSDLNKFHDESLLRSADVELLKKLAMEEPQLFGLTSPKECTSDLQAKELLLSLVDGIVGGGINSTTDSLHPSEKLKPLMERLCARYLYKEKHKGKALDPVGNFHLRNGACLERINWKGDLSVRRLKESYGMMVNYKYVLELVDQNHHDYVITGAKSITLGEMFDRSLLE
ncbi:predicted protein [Naegleria gruberi]|uniref:Predicted protein n=1 Tax=Naegleria gruberi TaxID=5762 RepID=D2W3U1_NAEGR|nr:uncharacterized protein NAEGRDRAFT_76065 [Naegleria gruberi]EFC36253.1 predicted protein [Naegleria gruberi]|eukprot:XP_002668997.1 predicted protein [Naegleria gruberi strain NEG-M]